MKRLILIAALLIAPLSARADDLRAAVDSMTANVTSVIAQMRGQIMADQQTIAQQSAEIERLKASQAKPEQAPK
jgi:hypothetical protein